MKFTIKENIAFKAHDWQKMVDSILFNLSFEYYGWELECMKDIHNDIKDREMKEKKYRNWIILNVFKWDDWNFRKTIFKPKESEKVKELLEKNKDQLNYRLPKFFKVQFIF